MWSTLLDEMDVDKVLQSERAKLLYLFQDRFESAKKQNLVGLSELSPEYNLNLNKLVAEWKSDKEYCAQRLAEYWKRLHRGVVVVVDNTDQFKGVTQDYCFTLAQQVAKSLNCLALISMRDERFQRSRIHGVLDAFQNSGYHLRAPQPQEIFLSRLRYLKEVLLDDNKASNAVPTLHKEAAERSDLVKFVEILVKEFNLGSDSPLYTFLGSCAHGNIRLALELFRAFAVSGYTNVGEMVQPNVRSLWKLRIHQVVRPLMTPQRFFYEEAASLIPNLFQLRSKSKGSHFTALRIINRLSRGVDLNNAHFIVLADLRDVFISQYELGDDFVACLDMLLRYRLVEANNRLDEYSDEVDQIRVTQYGLYLSDKLASEFTYLDLASTDCGVFSPDVASSLTSYGNQDYKLFRSLQKLERVRIRIEKVRAFLAYLGDQEQWEIQNVGVVAEDLVVARLTSEFERAVPDILRSAERNVGEIRH